MGDVPESARIPGFSPAAGLGAAATLGAIGFSLAGIYAVTGIGIPCPWRSLTHTLCPFCGATTMGVALLRGDPGTAWAANAFVLALLVGPALLCLAWAVELLGGPALRLPKPLSDQRLWYAVVAIAAVGFAVGRNLGWTL